MTLDKRIIIHTDGGSRGNPGAAAIGVVIESHDHDPSAPKWQKRYKERIGVATNNTAEYKALILALKESKKILSKESKGTDIELRTDSELMMKQMIGDYKIKDTNLKELATEAHKLILNFKNVKFLHIPREKNKEADKLVNEALDNI